MDIQSNQKTQHSSTLGFFFPQPPQLPKPTKQDIQNIKFRGKRTDLEVYHLIYGTKKLKACTYSRMAKRQDRKNKNKAKLLISRSPEQIESKGKKQAYLRQVEEIVAKEHLKSPSLRLVRVKKGKKHRITKRKHINKIRQKIKAQGLTNLQMKD